MKTKEELLKKYPYRSKEIDFLTTIYQKECRQWLFECFFLTGQIGTGKTSTNFYFFIFSGLSLDCLDYIKNQQQLNDPIIIVIRVNSCECQTLNWLLNYIMEIFIQKIKNHILENQENPKFIESDAVLQMCKKIPKSLSVYQFVNVFKQMNHFRLALILDNLEEFPSLTENIINVFYDLSLKTNGKVISIFISFVSWIHFKSLKFPMTVYLKQFNQIEIMNLIYLYFPKYNQPKYKKSVIKLIGSMISITRNLNDYISLFNELEQKEDDFESLLSKNQILSFGEIDESFPFLKYNELSIVEKQILISAYICSNVDKKKRNISSEPKKMRKTRKENISKSDDSKEDFFTFSIDEMMGIFLHLTKEYYDLEEKSLIWCSIDPLSILSSLITKDYISVQSSANAFVKKFGCYLNQKDAVAIGKMIGIDVKVVDGDNVSCYDETLGKWVKLSDRILELGKNELKKYQKYDLLKQSQFSLIKFLQNYEEMKKDLKSLIKSTNSKMKKFSSTEKNEIPLKPTLIRDFSLWEKHMVQAARGLFYQFYDITFYILIFIYELFTFTNFPLFKPKAAWYDHPVHFLENPHNLYTNDDEIPWPTYTDCLDYELEIGVIITKKLYNNTVDEVRSAIGGYVLFNDFSCRDIQLSEFDSGFGFSKCKNFANAFGNVVVTADEIDEFGFDKLVGEVFINDKKVATGATLNRQFEIEEMVSFACLSETILPGEVIGTGTLPNCSGIENGYLLQEKDVIELKMEPLGSLKNTIGEKSKVKENIWQSAATKKKKTIFTFGNIFYYSIIAIIGIMYLIFLFTPVGIQPKAYHQEYSNSIENQTAPIHHILSSEKFYFKGVHGPESIVFDKNGNIITSLSDGTVRRINFDNQNTQNDILFRTGVENNVDLKECNTPKNEHRCGRALGLEYFSNEKEEKLFIADAYFGIMQFDFKNLTKLVKPFESVTQMAFLNAIRYSKKENSLYFSDSSSIFHRRNYQDVLLHNGEEGRIFQYDLKNKKLHVLVDKLSFPNGITLNKDETALYFVETNRYTIKKLFISGPKKGVEETIQENIPCVPDNIISNDDGILWVGCFSQRSKVIDFLKGWPRITMVVWKLNSFLNEKLIPFFASKGGMIIGINEKTDQIEHIYRDVSGEVFTRVSEVREKDGYLYLGSVIENYITKFKKPN
eukprot:gene5364-9172_t